MKKILIGFILSFFTSSAMAGVVEGIKVLDVIKEEDSVSCKLHSTKGPKDNWFILILDKTDPEFAQKLKMVEAKKAKKEGSDFVINIPSFSLEPSGAVYRSADARFMKAK